MTRKLIQTTISPEVLRQLDDLAKSQGHRRASYLRHLVEVHVRALTPAIARATQKNNIFDILDIPVKKIQNLALPKKVSR